MSDRKKIAVAISGGVDSSVAALLLKEGGYDVVGVNMNLWSCFKAPKSRSCCSPEDRRDARAVCEAIGIPFVSVDMRGEFRDKIVLSFVKDYSDGRTPNPCIRCNTEIKFGTLLEWARKELGTELIATGHYARIESYNGACSMRRGADIMKDQSYFLFDIPAEKLAKIRFPNGGLKKDDVRKIATKNSLPVAEKAESQEICFIPDGDFAAFIEDFYPDFVKGAGYFIDTKGNKLGRHRGTHAYTIGQRRGLGAGFGERKYVKEIRPETALIVLAGDDEISSDRCRVRGLNLFETTDDSFEADVKIRYRTPAVNARVTLLDRESAEIFFGKPVRAITPGQAAVFYDGDLVLGGGWIC